MPYYQVSFYMCWVLLLFICKGSTSLIKSINQSGSPSKKGAIALLYPPIVIDDSSLKNAAESFTVALTLTLGGVRKCNRATKRTSADMEMRNYPKPKHLSS